MSSSSLTSSRPFFATGFVASLARILTATLVVAAAARVAFPIPFTPVPFTLQPLAVLGVGLALGPLEGSLAMLAYLFEGACGVPVFSQTGPGGLLQLAAPTGGYQVSYPLVAAVAGLGRLLPRRGTSIYLSGLTACLAATSLLFLAGGGWLAYLLHLSARQAWNAGVVPFLPGEIIKVLAAAGGFRALHRSTTR